MHRFIILLILPFITLCFDLNGASLSLVPTLKKGRVQPLGKECNFNEIKLPLKNGNWADLNDIVSSQENLCLYSHHELSSIYQGIQIFLNTQDNTPLSSALISAYKNIAGKSMKSGNIKGLVFPSLLRIYAEYLYFQSSFVLIAGILYLSAFFLFFFKPLYRLSWIVFILGFVTHSVILLLRVYILGRPPVANMTETILYVPWIIVLTGFCTFYFFKKRIILCSCALLGSLFLLFIFSAQMDQSFENVQPVLNSQFWLSIHVLMIVASFGVLIFCGLLGHLLLLFKSQKLEQPLLKTMYLGTGLLIVGTILGGVWAAQSWGRFWDWDPKESWAFISAGVYLITIHAYRYQKIKATGLSIGAILGLIAISFTWYGVNYILGTGLHSYGFGQGGTPLYLVYVASELIFCSFMIIKNMGRKVA